jgi:hypothetical protein
MELQTALDPEQLSFVREEHPEGIYLLALSG